jgi:hypothetical protein
MNGVSPPVCLGATDDGLLFVPGEGFTHARVSARLDGFGPALWDGGSTFLQTNCSDSSRRPSSFYWSGRKGQELGFENLPALAKQ